MGVGVLLLLVLVLVRRSRRRVAQVWRVPQLGPDRRRGGGSELRCRGVGEPDALDGLTIHEELEHPSRGA